jgi:hypothetical protein
MIALFQHLVARQRVALLHGALSGRGGALSIGRWRAGLGAETGQRIASAVQN